MTASVSVAAGASTTFDPYGLVTGVYSNVAPQGFASQPNPADTSIVAIAAPQNGTLSFGTAVSKLNIGSQLAPFFAQYDPVYTPNAGYSGSDSMTFEVHGMVPAASGQSEHYFDTLLTVDFTIAPGSGSGTATPQNTPSPFVINGQTLSIQGGNEDNLLDVDFTTATSFNINYNGYSGTFSTTGATPITAIDYTGGTVGDIIDVTTVASGNTATISSGMLSLVGPTYTINATGVEGIGLVGSGGDTAIMSDTEAQFSAEFGESLCQPDRDDDEYPELHAHAAHNRGADLRLGRRLRHGSGQHQRLPWPISMAQRPARRPSTVPSPTATWLAAVSTSKRSAFNTSSLLRIHRETSLRCTVRPMIKARSLPRRG